MSDEEVRILNRKVDRILDVLNNHDETSEKGLVAKVAELNASFITFVAQYNMDKSYKKGGDKVWRIVYGAVGAFLLWLIKSIGAAIAAIFTHT